MRWWAGGRPGRTLPAFSPHPGPWLWLNWFPTRKDGPGTITGNFPLLPVTPHSQTSQLKAGKSHWIYGKLRAINADRCD